MIWVFLFCVVLLLFAWSGLDLMITGIISPNVEAENFKAYVLWQTLLNQAVALLGALMHVHNNPSPNLSLAILMYITVVWIWIGGTLDWLYWMMRGRIKEWSSVLWLVPFKPKLWQYTIYTLIWLIGLITAWTIMMRAL